MSENLRLYQAAVYSMNAVVVRVDPARWDEPSKCAEWSCREVIGHVIWHMRAIASAAGSGEPLPDQAEAEVAGPFGTMKLDDRLRLAPSDVYTHSWDLGAAIGVDPVLDPTVAETILPGLMTMGDGLRRPGLMGDEVVVDADASVVDRFLAYCGRDQREAQTITSSASSR